MAFSTRKVKRCAALLTGNMIPSAFEQRPDPLFDQRPRAASGFGRPALLLFAHHEARGGIDLPEPVDLDRLPAGDIVPFDLRPRPQPSVRRSEEHTSELPSLMRISY